ncbi:MAG: hypothetical protein WC797_01490 [Candidatus Paceibacterota bacterium]|jgi:hypothetical protein
MLVFDKIFSGFSDRYLKTFVLFACTKKEKGAAMENGKKSDLMRTLLLDLVSGDESSEVRRLAFDLAEKLDHKLTEEFQERIVSDIVNHEQLTSVELRRLWDILHFVGTPVHPLYWGLAEAKVDLLSAKERGMPFENEQAEYYRLLGMWLERCKDLDECDTPLAYKEYRRLHSSEVS